jgi:hypothetical protein
MSKHHTRKRTTLQQLRKTWKPGDRFTIKITHRDGLWTACPQAAGQAWCTSRTSARAAAALSVLKLTGWDWIDHPAELAAAVTSYLEKVGPHTFRFTLPATWSPPK